MPCRSCIPVLPPTSSFYAWWSLAMLLLVRRAGARRASGGGASQRRRCAGAAAPAPTLAAPAPAVPQDLTYTAIICPVSVAFAPREVGFSWAFVLDFIAGALSRPGEA